MAFSIWTMLETTKYETIAKIFLLRALKLSYESEIKLLMHFEV